MSFDNLFHVSPDADTYKFVAQPSIDLFSEVKLIFPTESVMALSSQLARFLIYGAQPWLFSMKCNGENIGGAFGIIEQGRFRRGLFVSIVQEVPGGGLFWNGILKFISQHNITALRVTTTSKSTPSLSIPRLGNETARYQNVKLYILDLEKPEEQRKFSNNHKRNISKAKKAGVQLSVINAKQAIDTKQALEAHFNLTGSSVDRRSRRGESTALRATQRSVMRILESNHAHIYQAVLNGEVLSSKIVYYLDRYAFYYDGGTSPSGMKLGASHFLMSEIMTTLKKEGIRTLNLGLAADTSGELWRYKAGFDPELWNVESVNVNCTNWLKMIINALQSTGWSRCSTSRFNN
jgi:hypothetical protein